MLRARAVFAETPAGTSFAIRCANLGMADEAGRVSAPDRGRCPARGMAGTDGTGWRRSDRPTGQQSEDSTTESANSCMVDEAVVICSSLVADELRMMTVDGAMSIDDAFGRRVHQQINLGRLVVLFGRSSRKQRRARRMCSGRADSTDSAICVDTNLARSGPLV